MDNKKIIISLLQNREIEEKIINIFIEKLNLRTYDLVQVMNLFMISRKNLILRSENYNKFNDSYIKHYLYLTFVRFTNIKISNEKLRDVILYINSKNSVKSTSALITMLISLCDLSQLNIIVSDVLQLKQSHFFKICKRSLQLGSCELSIHLEDKITDKGKRIKIQLFKRYYSSEGLPLAEVENTFSDLQERFFIDYTNLLPSFVGLMPKEQDYFDLRYNKKKQLEIYKQIVKAIQNKTPFSFIRLSDGESYAFNDCSRLSRRQEVHWWGEELPSELRYEIKDKFKQNLKLKFDCLGMPTPYKFLHYVEFNNNTPIDLNVDLDKKVINRLAFVMKAILDKISTVEINAKKYTEDQINNVLFSEEIVSKLVRRARRVVIISGYQEKFLRDKIKHDALIVKEIPTHSMLSAKSETVKALRPLPFVYKDTLTWIEDNIEPGDLCLVSAGFIGKLFVGEAVLKGAVSLDVGQSLKVLF